MLTTRAVQECWRSPFGLRNGNVVPGEENNVLVSVLTPTFNRRGTFLPQCLENVRRQVGDAFTYEHIVIDDCSTDGTWDYIQQVAQTDPCVKPVRTKTNQMMAHALNCGLGTATGELVVPLDDDDLLLPRSLQMHVEFMTARPDVDWAHGHTLRIDENNRLLDQAWRDDAKYFAADYSDDPAELTEILLRSNTVINTTTVIRRQALLDVGGWDEHVTCQDWALWLRLAHSGKQHARRNSYIGCRRTHEHQLTTVHSVDGTYDRDRQYLRKLYGRP